MSDTTITNIAGVPVNVGTVASVASINTQPPPTLTLLAPVLKAAIVAAVNNTVVSVEKDVTDTINSVSKHEASLQSELVAAADSHLAMVKNDASVIMQHLGVASIKTEQAVKSDIGIVLDDVILLAGDVKNEAVVVEEDVKVAIAKLHNDVKDLMLQIKVATMHPMWIIAGVGIIGLLGAIIGSGIFHAIH